MGGWHQSWQTGTSAPVHVPAARGGDPEPSRNLGETLKRDIHPEYVETQVSCTCGASFTTRSTIDSGTIRAEVCSECHPFYTGKQKILDTGGRVARFEARFGKAAAGSKK
ncbi:large subunit ribosomal protein L31 [Streptomyces rochei]|nr:large subunit ribosomal protein L31 [Streptomyces rochei]